MSPPSPHHHMMSPLPQSSSADSEEFQLCPSECDNESVCPGTVLTPELVSSIVKQVEFYFSDANLATDKKLLKQIRKSANGFVPVKLLTNFRKVRSLTKDSEVISEALQHSGLLQLSDDGKKVRRAAPLPDFDPEDIQRRTIVVEHLPQAPTIESVTETFSAYGKVNLVRICSKESKGKLPHWLTATTYSLANQQHAFVEFCEEDSAVMAVAALHEADEWGSTLKVRHLLVAPSDKDGNITPMPVRRTTHPPPGGGGGGGATLTSSSSATAAGHCRTPTGWSGRSAFHDPRFTRSPSDSISEGGAAPPASPHATRHLCKLEKSLSERKRGGGAAAVPPCASVRSWSATQLEKGPHANRAAYIASASSHQLSPAVSHPPSHQHPSDVQLLGGVPQLRTGSFDAGAGGDSSFNSQWNAPGTPTAAQPPRPASSLLWDRRMLKERILSNVDGFLDNLLQTCASSPGALGNNTAVAAATAAGGGGGGSLASGAISTPPPETCSAVLAALSSIVSQDSTGSGILDAASFPVLATLKSPLSGHHLLPPGLPISPASPTYRRGGDGGSGGGGSGPISATAAQAAVSQAFANTSDHRGGGGGGGTATPPASTGTAASRCTPSRWQSYDEDLTAILQHNGHPSGRHRARRGSLHESIPGSPVAPCSPRHPGGGGKGPSSGGAADPLCPPTAAQRRLRSSDGGVALAAVRLLEACAMPLSPTTSSASSPAATALKGGAAAQQGGGGNSGGRGYFSYNGGGGHSSGGGGSGRKDYASWAAATPEFRAEATAVAGGGGGGHQGGGRQGGGSSGGGSLYRRSFETGSSHLAPDHQHVHIARGPDGGRGFSSPRRQDPAVAAARPSFPQTTKE